MTGFGGVGVVGYRRNFPLPRKAALFKIHKSLNGIVRKFSGSIDRHFPMIATYFFAFNTAFNNSMPTEIATKTTSQEIGIDVFECLIGK